jgi:aspartate aminotransferase
MSSVEAGSPAQVMLVNSPSNPTGRVFSAEVLSTIGRFCKGKNITLISDEIYSDLSFDPEDRTRSLFSLASDLEQPLNVVLTGGLSKTYSAGGWRIGYAIFPPTLAGKQLLTTTLAYASECWSAASAPAQVASVRAFSTSGDMDAYRAEVALLHKHCTSRLYAAVRDMGLDVPEPQGGFYIYPSYRAFAEELQSLGVKSSNDLSRWLITEFGVAALPGSAFGEDDANGPSGGKFRLRMATSYLYFTNDEDRYSKGYDTLAFNTKTENLELPLLDEAIEALAVSVENLRRIRRQGSKQAKPASTTEV